jgi:ATP-dependent Clp protease protease subunit
MQDDAEYLDVSNMSKEDLEREIAKAELAKLSYEVRQLGREEDEIDSSWTQRRVFHFNGVVNAQGYHSLVGELSQWAQVSKDPITVVFNSQGGSVIYGLAIYDFLRGLSRQGIPIRTVGIGEVASMGGVLLQAGDERILTPHAWMLIHEVSSIAAGKTSEVSDDLKFQTRLQDQCLEILSKRSKLSKAAIKKKWKKTDWWLVAQEAVADGFADRVAEEWTF